MFEVGHYGALDRRTSTSEITKRPRVITFFACLFSGLLLVCTSIYIFQDYTGISFFDNNKIIFNTLRHEQKVSVDLNFLDTSFENQSIEEYVENQISFTSSIRGNVTKHIVPMSGTNKSRILSTTYRPGNLNVRENGLLLSEGLRSRIIARSGQPVKYGSGQSSARFHVEPDGGATFASGGGWIYVSNSEFRKGNNGGVGALTFNANGDVTNYKMVLSNSRANCGGGKTPWGTWVSCEEYNGGHIWQVDPTGNRKAEKITMGNVAPSLFESFAYDVRDKSNPKFFVTKDHTSGELRRFVPKDPNWNDPWNILFGAGTLDYLVLDGKGKFQWIDDIGKGADSARRYFPNAEGMDVKGNQLFFVAKGIKKLFTLNLDSQTYRSDSTNKGLFKGQPDTIQRIVPSGEMLYFTEDGDRYAGVHGRNTNGKSFTILEGASLSDETTGLAFSPNKKHMYVAYQDNGILFEITRADGQAFDGSTLDIKYH